MNTNSPSLYDRLLYFVGTKKYITHTAIECKFNLRYVESRELVHKLQADGVIGGEFDVRRGGYEVLQKVYQADISSVTRM